MTHLHIGLLPSGRLISHSRDSASGPLKATPLNDKLNKLFSATSASEGLFFLATLKDDAELSPTCRFWRKFSSQYMIARCYVPAGTSIAPLDELNEEKARHLLLDAPPMRGAEYLSLPVLSKLWLALDQWVCGEVEESYNDFSSLLKKRAPHWHQVGRVCFHLAENKNDPDYPFAFMATYAPELSQQGQSRHKPLGRALEEYADLNNKKQLLHLLSPVDLASKSSPTIKALITSGDLYHPLAWTPQEAYCFLKEVSLYESCGIVVRLPDWWKKRSHPKVGVTLNSGSSKSFSANALIDFDVNIVLGDQTLTRTEWSQLMSATDKLVFLKGQWIEVDNDKLEEALTHWKTLQADNQGLTFIEGMRLLAGVPADLSGSDSVADIAPWSVIQSNKALSKMLSDTRQPERLKLVKPSNMLKATLRPYQETGVNWLWHLHQLGLGACLADDMGLGKTIQIISLLLILKRKKTTKPSLLILPSSLLENWRLEIEKFAPSLKIQFLHLSQINKAQLQKIEHNIVSAIASTTSESSSESSTDLLTESVLGQYDLVITTYSMLHRQTWLFDLEWQLAIADEAQAIKNPGTRQAKAAKKIKAQSKIALTGTPIENRLTDLWSLFDFICPGLLGSNSRFKKFTKALEEQDNEPYAPLRNLVQPYILRRLKTDKRIITDLPDKTELSVYCGLSKVQAALYKKSVDELSEALQPIDGIKRRGVVLAYLSRFKQICNHPSQLIGDGDYAPEDSGKFARLEKICEEVASRQEKVLIFTQFREMCHPIADFLESCFGRSGLVLHGGVAVKRRQQLVAQFQQEDGPPFFVISLKAGGTGLNLTAASHVIHFDRWWNPAVENQATDRAFRIGQKKNVLVHKFVCQGTIEEKIDALMTEKSTLASDLLEGGSEKLLTEMNDNELIDLVTLDVDRAVI